MGLMLVYVCVMGIAIINTAHSVVGATQVVPIWITKFDWTNEQRKLWVSLILTSSTFGSTIGCLVGGSIVKHGCRRALLVIIIITCVSVSLTLIRTIPTLLIGRL